MPGVPMTAGPGRPPSFTAPVPGEAWTPYEQAIARLGPAFAPHLQESDPGAAIAFLQDEFTGTDGTLLSAHTSDSGHSWTQHSSSATTIEISSNRIRSSTAANAVYYSSDVPTGPDYCVEGRVRCLTNETAGTGVCARVDTVADTRYQVFYIGTFNFWSLRKVVAGTQTTLGTNFTEVLAPGDERIVQLVVSGSSLRVYIDGVLRIEAADSSITAAGRPGVLTGGATASTSFHLDAVRAYKAATLIDSSANGHDGMAISGFTLGVDGNAVGEGTILTTVTPEQGYARFPGYQPFQPGTNRTIAGVSRIDAVTTGPHVMFGSRGVIAASSPVCVLEGVNDSFGGVTTVHYVSNVAVMSVLARQWFGVLPAVGQFFHWAFTVVDTGSGNQSVELFINGVSQGLGISGFPQPTWDAASGDYMLGMRGGGTTEAAPIHEFVGKNGMQAVFNRILTASEIQTLARTAGFLATGIPLGAASTVSSATLALTAQTTIPLNASSAVSSATLALTTATQVPLGASTAVSSATLALTAKTTVPLGAASVQSSATLALTTTTRVTLGASSAVSSATLFLTAQTYIPLGASSAQSSATLNLFTPGVAFLTLAPANALASATLALRAQTGIPLNPASVLASASLNLSAKTTVPLQVASSTVNATLALSVLSGQFIPLAPVFATSSGTLVIEVGRWQWRDEDEWPETNEGDWEGVADDRWGMDNEVRWPIQ